VGNIYTQTWIPFFKIIVNKDTAPYHLYILSYFELIVK
jgi:hypothetical protein